MNESISYEYISEANVVIKTVTLTNTLTMAEVASEIASLTNMVENITAGNVIDSTPEAEQMISEYQGYINYLSSI